MSAVQQMEWKELKIVSLLGSGSFAEVYKVRLVHGDAALSEL